jgi:uncharacterized lipoprotein YmbA
MRQPHTRHTLFIAMMIAILVLISSCIGKTPPATFYTLSVIQEKNSLNRIPHDIAIAIGPVTIPSELDRSQIITRDIDGRITLSELHRWAGPLQERIASVLSINLATLLGTDMVAPRISENIFPFTHYVILSINRFDGRLQGTVLLDVTWSIKTNNKPDPLIVKRSIIHEAVLSPGHSGLVAAQGKALSELSNRIAEAIRGLRN